MSDIGRYQSLEQSSHRLSKDARILHDGMPSPLGVPHRNFVHQRTQVYTSLFVSIPKGDGIKSGPKNILLQAIGEHFAIINGGN